MTPVEPIHIETFCEKLRPRVAVRTGVVSAYEGGERRVLGLHPAVFVIAAGFALVLLILEKLGG